MNPFYLMESEAESERLRIKSDREQTRRHLLSTGITSFQSTPRVVDAGSGIGHAAEVMGDLLRKRYQNPEVVLLDFSLDRLEVARQRLAGERQVDYRFFPCDLVKIPLESNSVDYVFCRFVFEYLSDPQRVFGELARILAPGGKLVIGDLDYNSMTHYPMDHKLEDDFNQLMGFLSTNKYLDPFVGRKLYRFFHHAAFSDIKVHFEAHHLFYGPMSTTEEMNWLAKLEQLMGLQKKGVLPPEIDLAGFKNRFREFLGLPDRFSYTPLILVEGRKPHERT
jgi:ubiquinone/menaquinone biosynthesis C-methylase UbiE